MKVIGYTTSVVTIVLVVVFLFLNPFVRNEPTTTWPTDERTWPTSNALVGGAWMMLFASLGAWATYRKDHALLYLVAGCMFLPGLYMLQSPSIFAVLGIAPFLYYTAGVGFKTGGKSSAMLRAFVLPVLALVVLLLLSRNITFRRESSRTGTHEDFERRPPEEKRLPKQ